MLEFVSKKITKFKKGGKSEKLAPFFPFCEDDGSASCLINRRLLSQHLLAIDDDNTLVRVADALA